VEVGKYYLAEPRDKNRVSLVCSLFDCLYSPRARLIDLINSHYYLHNQVCGNLVFDFIGSPIHPPPLGALKTNVFSSKFL
jgi:hypothetical protein